VKKFFTRLVELTQRHAVAVIAGTAVITVFLGYFALRIKVNPGMTNLIPQEAGVIRMIEKYGGQTADVDYLFVMAEAPDLFSVRRLASLAEAYEKIESIPTVSKGITPFNFVTFSKDGTRLRFAAMAEGKTAPTTEEAAHAFKDRLTSDGMARNLVISADGTTLCALFPVKIQDDYSEVLAAAENIVGPLTPAMDIRFAGMLTYNRAILAHLASDLPLFLSLALLIILVSYFFAFRTLRSLVLPIIVVVVGTVWTIGIMAILGFKLTIVQIMTPPLVLILGSAYSIHLLNQYYREARMVGTDKKWIVNSVAHINTTIFLASSTTVFGFASLLTASLPQLREFGVAVSFGIASCALLALIFLPAALSLLKPPTSVQRERVLEGFLARRMGELARVVMRGRFVVLVLTGIITVAFSFSLWYVRYQTDFTQYFRNPEKAVEDNRRLLEKLGGYVSVNYSLTAPDNAPNYFLNPEVLRKISEFEHDLSMDRDIPYITSFDVYLEAMNEVLTGSAGVPEGRPLILLLSRYFTALSDTPIGKNVTGILMNRDFSRYTLTIRIFDSESGNFAFEESLKKSLDRIETSAAKYLPAEIKGEFWGTTISMLYLAEVLTRNQITSIISSAVLVFLISALVFRSFKQGVLVIAPLAVGIMLNFIIMWIFSIPLDVLTITFSSVAIGIGVDNAIHLTIHHRRQRTIFPTDAEKAIEHTLKIGGRPMILTTLSIVAALMVFILSSFRPILYFGLLMSLALFMTTVGSLTLLPALLYFDARNQARRLRRAEKTEGKPAGTGAESPYLKLTE
jgi:predicted RND superfamily exporter protein